MYSSDFLSILCFTFDTKEPVLFFIADRILLCLIRMEMKIAFIAIEIELV